MVAYANEIYVRGSCKKFCHWVRISSVLRFIKHIFITKKGKRKVQGVPQSQTAAFPRPQEEEEINLQSIPPLLKHIFVTFLPSREKQINSPLLVSVGVTDK